VVIFRTTALIRHTAQCRPYGRLIASALTFTVTLLRILAFALTLAAAFQVAGLVRLLSSLSWLTFEPATRGVLAKRAGRLLVNQKPPADSRGGVALLSPRVRS